MSKMKPLSDQQYGIIDLLVTKPGLGTRQIKDLAGYALMKNAEQAIHGLIKRGCLEWDKHPTTGHFRYYASREGSTRLREAKHRGSELVMSRLSSFDSISKAHVG
jgi:hypothetical protein